MARLFTRLSQYTLADRTALIAWGQKLCEELEEQVGQVISAFKEAARINSYPTPTAILTASDAGSDATITIASHTRVYPVQTGYDVPDVSITGGSITGLSFATLYFVYYDDETLADTTPTFLATTTGATAQVGAAAGRHYVGSITTPADGAGDTSGTGSGSPGGNGNN